MNLAHSHLKIPGPLTNPFLNTRSIVLEHFGHINNLTFSNCFMIYTTQLNKLSARNRVVRPSRIFILQLQNFDLMGYSREIMQSQNNVNQ